MNRAAMRLTLPGVLLIPLLPLPVAGVLPAEVTPLHANSASSSPRAAAADLKPALPPDRQDGWELTFHDEFDGAKLDPTKWNDQYWHGRTHSNNELQYYAPDGYEVGQGRLRFKGEKRKMGGMNYTSGMITSLDHFSQTYGLFEIRAKFPKGKGYWPAFWLLPITKEWPPEIDILEILGHETNKVYFTTHWRDAAGKHQSKGDSFTGPDFSTDYHTFAVEWKPGECIWYVDGVERYRSTTGIPAEPMYIIANLAIGGDWPGNPDATTRFPGFMDIDYIRVYRQTGN
jgi:beta-glucanase (GH16 family)